MNVVRAVSARWRNQAHWIGRMLRSKANRNQAKDAAIFFNVPKRDAIKSTGEAGSFAVRMGEIPPFGGKVLI